MPEGVEVSFLTDSLVKRLNRDSKYFVDQAVNANMIRYMKQNQLGGKQY